MENKQNRFLFVCLFALVDSHIFLSLFLFGNLEESEKFKKEHDKAHLFDIYSVIKKNQIPICKAMYWILR